MSNSPVSTPVDFWFDPVCPWTYDQALLESHQEGITLVGAEVGSPIISVPASDPDHKIAFFGPVVSPAPTGDQAARLRVSAGCIVGGRPVS